ncbi:MAG: CARDB domain-containing protein [Candidatus Baldrarchaeia archaeon]
MFKKITVLTLILVVFTIAPLGAIESLGLEAGSLTATNSLAALPRVYIYPAIITGLKPGDTFTVSIMVSNLTNTIISDPVTGALYCLGDLYGLDINFTWDPTVLNYTSHKVMVPVEDYPNGVLHEPVTIFMDEVNQMTGTYHLACYCTSPAEPFNNPNQTNIIFNMTFEVLKTEVTALHFTDLINLDYLGLKGVALITYDASGKGCSPHIPHTLEAGIIGKDVKVSEIEIFTPTITQGYNASIDVKLGNYGALPENASVALYYNTTEITDWQNLTGTWELIDIKNVTLEPAFYDHLDQKLEIANKTISFVWNTAGILKGLPQANFYLKANVTALPDEIDFKNNQLLSGEAIHVVAKPYSDVTITDFEAETAEKFPLPAISGEIVKLAFNVLNNGTVPEENLNISLTITGEEYSETQNYNISHLDPGVKYPFEYLWNTTELTGEYSLTIQVSEVPNENDTTNNVYEETLMVIAPPTLNVSISKTTVNVGDTVTFDARSSHSNMPGETINDWQWEWKVYKIDIKDENLVYTYTEGPVMNYTIEEFQDYYRVVLTVTDSYGITYLKDRPLTKPYRMIGTIYVEKGEVEGPEGMTSIYIIVGIIAIIVIVAAVYYLKAKKGR